LSIRSCKEGPTGSCTYDANGPSCKVASLPDGLPSDLEQRLDGSVPDPNPSCILNAVQGPLDEKKLSREILGPWDGSTSDYNAHDGIHVMLAKGAYNVVTLPAMQGQVLHYAKQAVSGEGAKYSVLDIKLDVTLDGDPLVVSLKDMAFKPGFFKIGQRLNAGDSLGSVEGAGLDSLGEAGLHVTLMPFSAYKKYIQGGNIESGFPEGFADIRSKKGVNIRNRPYSSNARSAVPLTQLIDAGREIRSPFRCP